MITPPRKDPLKKAHVTWTALLAASVLATGVPGQLAQAKSTLSAPASASAPATTTSEPHVTRRPTNVPASTIAMTPLAGTRQLVQAKSQPGESPSLSLNPVDLRITKASSRYLAFRPEESKTPMSNAQEPSITPLDSESLSLPRVHFDASPQLAPSRLAAVESAKPIVAKLPNAPQSNAPHEVAMTPSTGGELPEGVTEMGKIIDVSKLKSLPAGALPEWMQKSTVPADSKFISATERLAQAQPGAILPAPSDPSFFDDPTSIQPTQPVTNSDQLPRQIEVAVSTFVVLLTRSDLATVAVADPDIADVAVVNARSVLLNGKSPGITSLVIIDQGNIRQYQVRVTPPLGQQPVDVQSVINVPGVTVTRAGDALILEGEVASADQINRAVEIAGLYSARVLNRLTLPNSAQGPGLAAQVQDAINIPGVTARLINGQLLLSGSVADEAQKERAERIATALAGEQGSVINVLETPRLTLEQLRDSLGASTPGAGDAPASGPMGINPADLQPTGVAGIAGALRDAVRPYITVRQVGDQIILEGLVLTEAQAAQATETASRTGLRVVNRLQIAPAPAEGAAFLNTIAAAIGRPGITVRGTPNRLVLEGIVANTNEAVAIEQIARGFTPNVDNMLLTSNPQSVNVDVSFFEINRTKLNSLGVTYTSLLDGPGNPVGFVISEPTATGTPGLVTDNAGPNINSPVQFTTRSPFQVSLRAMIENNDARLLSNPRTTVLSGRTATFQVGGQVPIPGSTTVTNAGSTTEIIFKDFGILVDVIPIANESGAITMRIRTEVSQPDFTIGVVPPGGGSIIPGFTRRATVTEVTIPPNGTMALAGLIQEDVTEIARKVPILGDIPILGKLFRSKRYQRNETELVIFVTPQLLPNTQPEGTLSYASVFAAGNTANEGTVLGNPGLGVFGTGVAGAIPAPAAGGNP